MKGKGETLARRVRQAEYDYYMLYPTIKGCARSFDPEK